MQKASSVIDSIMEPFTEMQKNFKILNIMLTTYCNLRCTECTANIQGFSNPAHYDLNDIKEAANYLQGFEILSLTGGEPTMHPLFPEIVPQLKKWFGVSKLGMATNGYKIIEYDYILHHFDEIMLSRYPNNKKEDEFLAKYFPDRPPGPTIHLTTARRARKPKPCCRSNITKLSFGRLYPCCQIVTGYEYIGVPLSSNFRESLIKTPLPCFDCWYAEEDQESNLSGENEVNISSSKLKHLEKETNEEIRIANGWPRLRNDIAIYGLELDSWMSWEADIRLCQHQGASRLSIVFESHSPKGIYPITMIFRNESDKIVQTHVVIKSGRFEVFIDLNKVLTHSGYSWMKLQCDKTYSPHSLDGNNPDKRELGIRVVSLRYI